MSKSVNRVTLLGRVGKEPMITRTENNVVIAKFALATNESFFDKSKNKKIENTYWHNITCFGKLGELAEKFLQKGMLIYLEAKLTSGTYIDKNQITRYTTDIVCIDLNILSPKSYSNEPKDENRGNVDHDNAYKNNTTGYDDMNTQTFNDNDIPF